MINLTRFIVSSLLLSASFGYSQHQMENLERGVIAMRSNSSQVYVGWRLLGTEPSNVSFNLYRSANGGSAVKLNGSPITNSTNYLDTSATLSQSNAYHVRPVIDGDEQDPSPSYTLPANAPVRQFLNVPLQKPAGGTTPDGVNYTYSANDATVADLDDDGEYEIILKWDPSNAKDNAHDGYTGNVFIDAYKLNGQRLWRIDLGINIRAGAHYTQFMVYDLDGDGKAELACKTADGTRSGTGQLIGSNTADYRNSSGRILSGPEYFTLFNGQNGAILATTNYVVPRGNLNNWGDNYGNRSDRFLATVAYLDGTRPSVVMCRGYYTRAVLAAWDWRDGQLTQRWVFDTDTSSSLNGYRGQGAHSLTVGDVDSDGRDEIVYGACTIDDNGTGLYTTGIGHGDALHMSDMDPSNPGLEVWMVHESPSTYGSNGSELHDAATGQILYGVSGQNADVGRGVAADIDPRYSGFETWASRGGLHNVSGTQISSSRPGSMNFLVYWDGDFLREILDGTTISKWDWNAGSQDTLLSPSGISSNNGTKSTPTLSADIFGDWREEVVWRDSNSNNLRIYTTTNVTSNRLYTLMHDRQYRLAIAWQNVAYNQPPHAGYFIGDGMSAPSQPNIYVVGSRADGGGGGSSDIYQAESATYGGGVTIDSNNSGFNGSGFANFPSSGGYLEFSNVDGGSGGQASIDFRYALGASSSRTGNLIVNGATQSITFTSTGSWTSWSTHSVSVPLNSDSTNTIRLESTGSDLANIDQLSLQPPASGGGPVSGQTYYIASMGSALNLDINAASTADGANVQQWTFNGQSHQQFTLTDLGNGYWSITANHSGKLLDVSGASTSDGANVLQWSAHGGTNQQWQINDLGNGEFSIVARHSGKALTVEGSSISDGANVEQRAYSGSSFQRWELIEP